MLNRASLIRTKRLLLSARAGAEEAMLNARKGEEGELAELLRKAMALMTEAIRYVDRRLEL